MNDQVNEPSYYFVLPNGEEVEKVSIRFRYDDEAEEVDAADVYQVSPARVKSDAWRRIGYKEGERDATFWDLGNLLQSAGVFLRDRMKLEIADSARYSRDEAQSFLDAAVEVIEEITKTAAKVTEAGEAAYEEYNAVYRRLYEMRRDFIAKVKDLPEINIPYGFKEMITLAERCEGMSPSAWERMIRIADALRPKERAESGE